MFLTEASEWLANMVRKINVNCLSRYRIISE